MLLIQASGNDVIGHRLEHVIAVITKEYKWPAQANSGTILVLHTSGDNCFIADTKGVGKARAIGIMIIKLFTCGQRPPSLPEACVFRR